MPIGIDPKIDYAFKRLFGMERNRDILLSLLNAVLGAAGDRALVDVEILNPFNPQDTEDAKLSIVDVKARDGAGRHFSLEMQLVPHRRLPERLLYYWACLYTQQLFAGDDYDVLCPAVTIAICDFALFPGVPGHHHCFELSDPATGIRFSSHLALHTIELAKFEQPAEGLVQPLDQWSFFLRHAADWELGGLPIPSPDPALAHAFEELSMIAQSDRERELYEARLKAWRDERARLKQAQEEGVEQGFEHGFEHGQAVGELVGQIRLLEQWLGQAVSERTALADLPLETLRQRQQELEAAFRNEPPRPS